MAAQHVPKITWDGNTITFGFPLDNVTTWSEPLKGSEWQDAPSGERDAWIVGTRHFLEADVRWIPTATGGTPSRTGWDGSTGWRAFLEYARDDGSFEFFPDEDSATSHTSKLLEPLRGRPEVEQSTGERRIRLRIFSTDASAYAGY